MKKLALLIICHMFVLLIFSQDGKKENKVSFELGNGLNFNFKDHYKFKLSGMIMPSFAFSQFEIDKPDLFFNVKRVYFNFSGTAVREKVSFFVQTDFSQINPLLDAWIAYQPVKQVKFVVGQKQNIANNREMLIMEDKLQFADRGLLSTSFSQSGRELGLFVETELSIKKFMIQPKLALTTGDGRISANANSGNADLGGLKYSARLDFLPLGNFSKHNRNLIADLMHEDKPKFVLGIAASYNDGASNSVGEGQNDFMLYNVEGNTQLPDYRQLYGDFLLKYKGISLLGEVVYGTATNLNGTFVDDNASLALVPNEISEYLALGSAYNVQLGYATKSGYAIDVKYEKLIPEFDSNVNSIIQEADVVGVLLSKYFKGNDLKIQGAFTYTMFGNQTAAVFGGLTCQVVL